MNRRLLLVFGLVVAAGVVRFSLPWLLTRLQSTGSEARPSSPTLLDSGPPAPTAPPKNPPPGRPFAGKPVSYTTPAPTRTTLQAAAKDTNLVICVLDAARADHIGCYGYPRDTTPNLDRLAKESLVFAQHFSQIPQTCPSTISLLTGQYPDTHGVLNNVQERGVFQTISPATFTMEQGLQRAGFHTFLLSGNPAASPGLGVGMDFMYRDYQHGMPLGRGDEATTDLLWKITSLTSELKRQPSPFFVYLHLLPPHSPYAAPEEMKALFRDTQPPRYWHSAPGFVEARNSIPDPAGITSGVEWGNAYDANLRWADACLGQIEQMFKQAGLWSKTLFIITSDHGEAFREHGYVFHVDCPYDEALHIPLLVRFPGPNKPVGRIGALTQTIDLLPTLFDLYQLPYPRSEVQGKSLLPLLVGETDRTNDFVFSRAGVKESTFAIVRDARSTLLLCGDGRKRALYDMEADPWQTRNVISQHPNRAAALVQAFARFAKSQRYPPLNFLDPNFKPQKPQKPGARMSEETRRKLKSLGYLK